MAFVRPKQPEPLPARIDRRRIYILPTGFGLFLVAVLGAMLLGGLNYNNNPALLLVFVLGAVVHNSFVHAHLILSGVRLKALHADPVFAGQALPLKFRFDADGRANRRDWSFAAATPGAPSDLAASEDASSCCRSPRHDAAGTTPAACA